MPDKPLVRAGQVWRENDARATRYIRVTGTAGDGVVSIETVYNADGAWFRCHGTRMGQARLDRFNGKRGGYVLQEDAP